MYSLFVAIKLLIIPVVHFDVIVISHPGGMIDIEKKVNSCSCESRKRFGSVAPDRWSNSDSNSDLENDPGAANKKRLSL